MEDMHMHLKKGVTDISIMQKYVEKCKEMKLNRVLFLDHGNRMSPKHTPVLNNSQVIDKFFENIKIIKENNPDIEINAGIESDFSYNEEFKEKEIEILRSYPFDYVIGSVHGMEKANYIDYLQANIDMIKTYPINIIGHLKLRKEYEQYICQNVWLIPIVFYYFLFLLFLYNLCYLLFQFLLKPPCTQYLFGFGLIFY